MQPPAPGSFRQNGLTIAQLAISGLGAAFALLAAAGLALIGLAGLFSGTVDIESSTSLFSLAWISLLAALLALPSVIFAVRRLGGWTLKLPRVNGFRLANLVILLWPLVLALGHLLSGTNVAWLVLPPLQLLAFGLPIWWLVEIARRKLWGGSHQRSWGLLATSIFITTPAVIVVETIVLVVLFTGFILWLMTQPELAGQLEQLALQILNSAGDSEAIMELARPFLQNPWVVFGILALLGGLMPAVEELMKPLAMWALIGRRLSPAEGFTAGAICGAAFALLESLFNMAGPVGEGWAVLAVGRAGTGLLHIATTALVGWAMASAWRGDGYGRSFLTYCLAVAMHGLWNILSVLSGLSVVFDQPPESLRLIEGLSRGAPIGIIILVLLLFMLLWGSNRRLQQETALAETDAQATPIPAYRLESTIHGNDPRSR